MARKEFILFTQRSRVRGMPRCVKIPILYQVVRMFKVWMMRRFILDLPKGWAYFTLIWWITVTIAIVESKTKILRTFSRISIAFIRFSSAVEFTEDVLTSGRRNADSVVLFLTLVQLGGERNGQPKRLTAKPARAETMKEQQRSYSMKKAKPGQPSAVQLVHGDDAGNHVRHRKRSSATKHVFINQKIIMSLSP
jgi:hypothetical protein